MGLRERTGARTAVYVDGVRVAELADDAGFAINHENIDAKWSVGHDGVLTFIAADGNSVKRFRITPGSDTSVDTLAKMNAIQ